MSRFTPDFARIGIIGGGQLGRMMMLAGTPLGFEFGVLTPSATDPAARLAAHHVAGSLTDAKAIRELCRWAHVTTYEIEHIHTGALRDAAAEGAAILPRPDVLELVNDKLEQKRALERAGVPVPPFSERPNGYPTVQKLRHGGYDGRGVKVLENEATEPLDGASYYEDLVRFRSELAVVVARSVGGGVETYPVVEMEFDPEANICSRVIVPARVPTHVEVRARDVAIAAVEAIGGVGVVAVELFLNDDGSVLVNELAPRPHNSGHLTIEASATSQFEQHLRAITGLPLGATTLRTSAVMINVLGAPDAIGQPRMPAMAKLLSAPGVHLHWYGKETVRPYRKMGHVTVVADDLGRALAIAREVEPYTRVTAARNQSTEE
ncbi:MAG: 5-(carboxyamino)imidazole ribonucleotide synthase [Spirochaetota bacterium]